MFITQEQNDVFVDACASDHHSQLLFMSVYGRDTSIQQFMARLHQPAKDGGVDDVSLVTQFGAKPAIKVLVGDPRRLEKVTGRMPRTGLLGNFVHAWIFDPAMLAIDHAAQAAWIVSQRPEFDLAEEDRAAWRLVKDLSPVPLLDAWQAQALEHVRGRGGVIRPPCVGSIRAVRIELQDDFPKWVSEGVQDGFLAVPDAQAEHHQIRLAA